MSCLPIQPSMAALRRIAVLVIMLATNSAFAHRFAPSALHIEVLPNAEISVRWKTPIQTVSDVPMVPRLPAHCAIVEQSPFIAEGTGKLRQTRYRCEKSLVAYSITVDGLAANQSSALLTIVLPDGVSHQAVLTAAEPIWEVPATPDGATVVSRYSVLGAEHIWGGIDHLLFVLGLLLLVGKGKRLVITITAFTLGHSITLAMVTLGLFDYPVALVEFLIAFSIFLLAVELTRAEGHSALWRWPWLLAGGFGLLHGMGFAGALAETGLPPGNIPLALLFFNLGIELGQLAFIALLLLMAKLLTRVPATRHPAVAQAPVLVLGVLSATWCLERGAEVLR